MLQDNGSNRLICINKCTSYSLITCECRRVKYFDTDELSRTKDNTQMILAEWARTNLFTDSEDFSLWTKPGTWVITPNATIAPDGRMTIDLLTLSTSNEWQSVNKTITTTASIYGYSVYVKPNGHNYVQLFCICWYQFLIYELRSPQSEKLELHHRILVESSSSEWMVSIKSNLTPTVRQLVYHCSSTECKCFSMKFCCCTGSSESISGERNSKIDKRIKLYPNNYYNSNRNIDSLIMNTKNAIDTYGACSFIATLEDNAEFDRRAFSFTGIPKSIAIPN